MGNIQINVRNTNGQSTSVQLDGTDTLDAVRTFLTGQVTDNNKKVMDKDDFFLDGETDLPRLQEKLIPLINIVKTDEERQQKYISIGTPSITSPLTGNEGVDDYNLLNVDQKMAVFDKIKLFRGLTVTDSGFGIAENVLYSWEEGYMPKPTPPDYEAEISTHFSFSKITQSLTEFGSESASLSFESPYASGEAEFKHEKSKTTSSEKVTEYMTAKFVVRKVQLRVGLGKIHVSTGFIEAVQQAVKGNESTLDGYANLLGVLNAWGYYLPLTFTLGGALISTDSTQISEYSEAESEKEEYGASFKAEFKGIGGGGGFKKVEGWESSSSTNTKYQDIQIKQKSGGGDISTPDDYSKWTDALKRAANWRLAGAEKLHPSLVLLVGADPKYKANHTLSVCIGLISQYAGYPSVKNLQPYLDMREYNTVMQEMFDVFD